MSANAGIDYSGPGATCNRNIDLNIRFGIIPVHDLRDGGGAFYESAEQDYGEPHCPQCGSEVKPDDIDNPCPHCGEDLYSDSCYGEECTEYIDNEEYHMWSDDHGDLWISKSPYYTYAQFCSPCAPGACYLKNAWKPTGSCYNFKEDQCVCDDVGEPKGQCENCGYKEHEHPLQFPKAFCLPADWFDGDKAPYPVFSAATNELVKP